MRNCETSLRMRASSALRLILSPRLHAAYIAAERITVWVLSDSLMRTAGNIFFKIALPRDFVNLM